MKFKLHTPGYYSVFVTALLTEYSEKLISGMVKKGYAVRACLQNCDTAIAAEGGTSALIVFSLYSGQKTVDCNKVHTDLVDIVVAENMFIYSVIVTETTNSMFAGTNIFFPKKPQPPALPPIPPDTMRKMN